MYTGIEHVVVDVNSADARVAGSDENDQMAFAPIAADSGTLTRQGDHTDYRLIRVRGLDLDLGGGADEVTIVGTVVKDEFTATETGSLLTVDVTGEDGRGQQVPLQSTALIGVESLRLDGLAGRDTFEIMPGETPISIDGGDPIGEQGGTGDFLAVPRKRMLKLVPNSTREAWSSMPRKSALIASRPRRCGSFRAASNRTRESLFLREIAASWRTEMGP
jgi:hypothetical protein